MSRRSIQKRRTLGYAVKRDNNTIMQNASLTDSQCGGDPKKFNATRPNRTIKGKGTWLDVHSGIGAVGTRPEGQRGPSLKSARVQ